MTAQSSKGLLRELAITVEREAKEVIDLGDVWLGFCAGRYRGVDGFFTEESCYLIVESIAPERAAALSGRRLQVLEALLRGVQPKVVAQDLKLSTSTVSHDARVALQQLGFECTPARVHPLLSMSAQAAHDAGSPLTCRAARFAVAGETLQVIGAARPDDRLAPILAPAQYAVVRGLVEGKNYLEIARARGTSHRTVANQLASAFLQLGVSGRGSLIHQLIATHAALA